MIWLIVIAAFVWTCGAIVTAVMLGPTGAVDGMVCLFMAFIVWPLIVAGNGVAWLARWVGTV